MNATEKAVQRVKEKFTSGNSIPVERAMITREELEAVKSQAITESLEAVREEIEERRNAHAELAGTNSCVDDKRLAKLFLKHREIAQDIQHKYIAKTKKCSENTT